MKKQKQNVSHDTVANVVNHPPHYTNKKWEVIDILEEFFSDDPLLWQCGKYRYQRRVLKLMWSFYFYYGFGLGVEWTETELNGDTISHFLINLGCLRIQRSE
jgi:hypothetical protein